MEAGHHLHERMWRFLIVEEPSGRYTWRLIGANGRVVAVAGQSWETPG